MFRATQDKVRAWLLVAAVAVAGIAMYLQRTQTGDVGLGHQVCGTYRSELLGKEVSPYSLQAFVLSEEFRSAVGGRVEVQSDSLASSRVSVTAFTSDEKELSVTLERALQLLSAKIRDVALAEVSGALELVREAQATSAQLKSRRYTGVSPDAGSERAVSSDDTAEMLLLTEEIGQLETFLRGEEMSATLRTKLERDSLNKARQRVRDAELEMGRLAQLFKPSNNVLRAQREYAKKVREELRGLEQELARARLQALRAELKKLEKKATSLIEENKNRPLVPPKPAIDQLTGPKQDLLSERASELEIRAEAISSAPDLALVGSLEFGQVSDRWYSAQVACWLGALALFLMALFKTSGPRAKEPSEPTAKMASLKTPSWELRPSSLVPQPDRYDLFFSRLYSDMESVLGDFPRRILVLGDARAETRLAFSIRFAESLSREHSRVRLVDFDLEGKRLSERLGRDKLPGVANVLTEGGAVDEFFSSIAGTSVQFAPAGSLANVSLNVSSERIHHLLELSEGVVVVDASGSSPLHLLSPHLDSVLYAVDPSQDAGGGTSRELELLQVFQEAGLPIWEVHVNEGGFYPLS